MIRNAIILAGGEGTRLRPVTFEIPKPLIPVQQKSILTWQTEWMAREGVEHILVIIPPKWQDAFERWRRGSDLKEKIELWVEPEPMGTMGALVHHLSDRVGEPVFVTNGDELKRFDLQAFAHFHHTQKTSATIALVTVPNPSDYGVAELVDGRIIRFHEKPADPPTNLINSGFYLIEPSAFRDVPRDKTFLMFEKDLFPMLAESGRLGGCPVVGPWYDCGTMERWERAIKEWK